MTLEQLTDYTNSRAALVADLYREAVEELRENRDSPPQPGRTDRIIRLRARVYALARHRNDLVYIAGQLESLSGATTEET